MGVMTFNQSGKTSASYVIPTSTGSFDLYQYNAAGGADVLRYDYDTGIFYDSSSNIIIEADGDVTPNNLTLRTSDWDVYRISSTSGKGLGDTSEPDFAQVLTDGAGSAGVYTYLFDPAVDEQLFFTFVLLAGYTEAKGIYPFVEWKPTSIAASAKVIWGLEYSWQNPALEFSNTTLIYTTGSTNNKQNELIITEFGKVAGAAAVIGSVLLCRVFRAASEIADTYADDAALIGTGIYYQKDTLGSANRGTK